MPDHDGACPLWTCRFDDRLAVDRSTPAARFMGRVDPYGVLDVRVVPAVPRRLDPYRFWFSWHSFLSALPVWRIIGRSMYVRFVSRETGFWW